MLVGWIIVCYNESIMQKLTFRQDESALVVIAHPDDEIIWMGGLILRHAQVRWTIFSLCRASDNDRAPKFSRVCELYGAQGIITDLEDEDGLSVKATVPIIKQLIVKEIGKREYDYVFTHGANGEYGHPRHIGVHQAVKDLIKTGALKAKIVCCFNYRKNEKQPAVPPVVAKPDSDYMLKLTQAEFKNKKKIVAEMYGYAPRGIDVGYCVNPEAFKIKAS